MACSRSGRARGRRSFAVGATVLATLLAAGCGSSDDAGSGSTAGTTAARGSAAAARYAGPEAGLPKTLAEPDVRPGFDYKVGFLATYAAVPALAATIDGARTETEKLGGTFILKDAQLSANTQASQIAELVSQGVDAIIVNPVFPDALRPGIAAAQKKGIEIVTQDAPPIAGQPLLPGTYVSVLEGRDTAAHGLAQAAAEADPGGSFATIGLSLPIPILQYGTRRGTYWAEQLGMKHAATVEASADTPAGAATAMNSILAKHPGVSTVFCYNDGCAAAAAAAARASGRPDVKVWGNNGEPVAMQQIEAGRVHGTWNADFTEVGRLLAIASYDLVTEQNLPLPKQIAVGGEIVTKDNVSSVRALGSDAR
jgi:ribose transport system substrate-binding protein